jgi:hypothetical protein
MTLPDMIDPKAVRQMEPHEYNIRVWADKQAIEVIDRQKDRIRALQVALRKIATQECIMVPLRQGGNCGMCVSCIARSALETPEAMHARIVTETSDALAQEHFKGNTALSTAQETIPELRPGKYDVKVSLPETK